MTLSPILDASPIIQAHVAAVVPAAIFGPVALFRRRKDRLHKVAGYVGLAALAALALTGLLIPSHGLALVGPFGPIHLLSLTTLAGIAYAIHSARRGDIAQHRRTMEQVWFGALGLAGIFTLVPGRIMNRAIFGPEGGSGWIAIGALLVGLALLWRLNRRAGWFARA